MRLAPSGPLRAARSRRVVLFALAAAALASPSAWAAPLSPIDASPPPNLLGSRSVVVGSGSGLPALPAGIDASSWLVADLDTGAVLAARDAHAQWLPASTLKVLTALSLIHRIPANAQIPVRFADITVDGTKIGLVPGKSYSTDSLFTGLLIASGNDAANVLATAAGGLTATLGYMKEEANLLHAEDTVAGTPSGLDAPGEHTSAYDLALFGRAALADPMVAKYLTIRTAIVRAPGVASFQIANHNPLLGRYDGTVGVKAGYTVAAQATFIGAATRGGHRIIVTLMHAYPHFTPFAKALLDWGFAVDGRITPVGMLAAPGPVPSASAGTVALSNRDAVHGVSARPTNAAAVRHTGLGVGGWFLRILLGLVLVVATLRLRVLRRRRRYRSRLKLPPF